MNQIRSFLRAIGTLAIILWMCMADTTPFTIQLGWLAGIVIVFTLTGDFRKMFQ